MDQRNNSNPPAQTPIGTSNPTVMRQIQQELRMHGCLDSQNVRVLIGSSQEGRTVIEDTLMIRWRKEPHLFIRNM